MTRGRTNTLSTAACTCVLAAGYISAVAMAGCGNIQRPASVLDYSNQTRLVIESPFGDESMQRSALREHLLQRAGAYLNREQFTVSRQGALIVATRGDQFDWAGRFNATIWFPEQPVLSGKAATACVVDVTWRTDFKGKQPGIGAGEAHTLAENVRNGIVNALWNHAKEVAP